MLSFDTSLSNALTLSNTTAFWVLKLYYNSEGDQVYQADGTTANLINKLGSELVQDGDNPDPREVTWTRRDRDGNDDGWSDAAPSAYADDETASMINTLTGNDVDAGLHYSLTFTVGVATLSLRIGGGDLTGNTLDEQFVSTTTYAVGTHTVTFTAEADRTHLWFTADEASAGNGTIDDVTLKRSGYAADATSIIVDHGAAFTVGDYIKIENEILEVTNISSETLTVVRGAKGSTKAAHVDNTAIYFDNWVGVSDSHRVDDIDIYYGIVSSWGTYSQSLDFFNFTTSTGNMSIRLLNTDKTIEGGRFSDLFSSNNFANRKWELFLNTSQAGTYDTAARMIGTGVIGGEIKYDYDSVTFTLLDLNTRHHKRLPTNVVDSSTYANAPEKNIDKPIPITYGDFFEKTDIGTIPTTHFDRFKTFYKNAFPAIITDKFDVGVAGVEAYVDSEAMHTLSDENVYYYKDGNYATITGTVDATTNNPRIEFSGSRCKAYFPLSSSGFTIGSGTGTHTYETNISNGDFGDSNNTTIAVTSGNNITVNFGVTPITKLGEFVGARAVAKFGTVSGSFSVSNYLKIAGQAFLYSAVATDAEITATLIFDDDEKASWDFTGVVAVLLNSASGDLSVEISEMGVVVEFDIDNIETHKVQELYEVITQTASALDIGYDEYDATMTETVTRTRTKTINSPAEIEYVYVSGKGRKYKAWIDTINGSNRTDGNGDAPDPNYGTSNVIKNPVYMIEDILRTEVGLDSSSTGIDIDIESFDYAGAKQTGTSGNTRKGDTSLLFNDAIADIMFSFSQYKFINSRDLINRICKQICSWVWISGDSKFKIRVLKRPTDTFAADKTIDFNDINLKSISKTNFNTVRNDITVNYNYDYGQGQNLSQVNTADSTSKGTGATGNNQTLNLVLDAECIIDETTATQLADAYKAIFKDRKVVINFDIMSPKYNDLEITDHIDFSNWDSNLKFYGTAYNADFFIVQKISKRVDGCSITAIKVDA